MSPQGGKREGAGRRPTEDAARHKPRRVYLTDGEYEKARRLGNGNVSKGVRRALNART